MLQKERLRVAIQKKGRLNDDSLDLLSRCGIKFRLSKNSLIARSKDLPIDLLLVRDDDIPTLVMDGVCDLGIVGENVLFEKELYQRNNGAPSNFSVIQQLGFGRCRLSIAVPDENEFSGPKDLENCKIATSYPNLTEKYLLENNIKADVLTINGSVEISPRLGMADVICDLVSTGKTLEENNLKEVAVLIESQAVLIKAENVTDENKLSLIELLLQRITGVLKAKSTKYIMLHAPKNSLENIRQLLPGSETPSVLPLEGYQDKVAVHLVSQEGVFWETLEKLKNAGASSILVLPIEKMLE